jgi:hypothetical protein
MERKEETSKDQALQFQTFRRATLRFFFRSFL